MISIENTFEYGLDPGKTYVLFARHGESEINERNCVGGSSEKADLDLTQTGMEEAGELGDSLIRFKDNITAAYHSPLKRAIQTAILALLKFGIDSNECPALREKFFGEELDGQPEDVYNRFAAKEKAETQEMTWKQKWSYKVVPDGESFKEIFARVRPFMIDAAKKHPGGVILAFGHKVSSIKVPCMGVLQEQGIEVDYRDPLFNDPINGATALFEVDPEKDTIRLVAIDGFYFSFLQDRVVRKLNFE